MHAQAFFALVDPRSRPHGHDYRLQPLAAGRRTSWTPRSLYPHEPRASRPLNPTRTPQPAPTDGGVRPWRVRLAGAAPGKPSSSLSTAPSHLRGCGRCPRTASTASPVGILASNTWRTWRPYPCPSCLWTKRPALAQIGCIDGACDHAQSALPAFPFKPKSHPMVDKFTPPLQQPLPRPLGPIRSTACLAHQSTRGPAKSPAVPLLSVFRELVQLPKFISNSSQLQEL
jgi:hypothetical protein